MNPPIKRPRQINGLLLDVRTAASFLGGSEKQLRGMVDRRLVPFRRINSRIVFLRSELEQFLFMLPGCTADEAKANMEARHDQ